MVHCRWHPCRRFGHFDVGCHHEIRCGSDGLGFDHFVRFAFRYLFVCVKFSENVLQHFLYLFAVLSCVYSGMKFVELYSEDKSFGDIEITTNVSSYLDQSWTWMAFLLISGTALLIVLLLLCWLRTRISIAIELIEEASIAVGDMMSTLFFPLIPFVVEVIYICWFILVATFLASSNEKQYQINISEGKEKCENNGTVIEDGHECNYDDFGVNGTMIVKCGAEDVRATCDFYKFGPTTEATYLGIYNLFGFFWGLFFLEAFDQMVLAGGKKAHFLTLWKLRKFTYSHHTV